MSRLFLDYPDTKQNLDDYELSKTFSTSYYRDTKDVVKSRESVKSTLLCENGKWLGFFLKHDSGLIHDSKFIRCHECDGCKTWRIDNISKTIENKFNIRRDININNMYVLELKEGMMNKTNKQILLKIKYLIKRDDMNVNLLMNAHNPITGTTRYLLEGYFNPDKLEGNGSIERIAYGDVLGFVKPIDKYRFLGKLYNYPNTMGAKEPMNVEAAETRDVLSFKYQTCRCGLEYKDHILKVLEEYEITNYKAIPEYEEEFELMKKRFYGIGSLD